MNLLPVDLMDQLTTNVHQRILPLNRYKLFVAILIPLLATLSLTVLSNHQLVLVLGKYFLLALGVYLSWTWAQFVQSLPAVARLSQVDTKGKAVLITGKPVRLCECLVGRGLTDRIGKQDATQASDICSPDDWPSKDSMFSPHASPYNRTVLNH